MNETKIDVYGRVQGIGFRKKIKEIAENLQLKGSIKNNADGSVTIIAHGDKKKLEEFHSILKNNPGFSKINNIFMNENESIENNHSFKIKKNGTFLNDKTKSIINLGKYILKPKTNIPLHVAIIPDGNRRWAKHLGKEATFGHYQSANYENLKSLFNEAKKLGVKYFSIWGFSTENWKRDDNEIKNIFQLVENFIDRYQKDLHKDKIRFRHIGRKERLPVSLMIKLEKLEKETKNYTEFNVQLYLDYGGRDELIWAVNKLLKSERFRNKNNSPIREGGRGMAEDMSKSRTKRTKKNKEITEEEFKKYLDTNSIPDPDLIIRTSGEYRLSGFLPFQSVYSELYFTDKHFPDFNIIELRKALQEYSKRKRRFGGNKSL